MNRYSKHSSRRSPRPRRTSGRGSSGSGRGWGRGSGVVIAPGQVLTVAHVLRGDEVAVTFADGEVARRAGRRRRPRPRRRGDRRRDGRRAAVAWEPGEVAARRGTAVLALANPGGRGLRTTFGLVSATGRAFRGPRGRRVAGSIEHTAPLPRGSSGGPLVDTDGRLLGLNAVRRDGGFILALPADAALQRRVDELARGEAAERPRLGVALAPPRVARQMRAAVGLPERDGLLVRGVVDDSPAARAGLAARRPAGARPASRRSRAWTTCSTRSTPRRGTLALTVVRGTEERERGARPDRALTTLQFVKSCVILRFVMPNSDCPVCRTADIVCGKWTLLVIRDLAEGRSRFCELERSLGGHLAAHALAAAARARGGGHRRAPDVPRGPAARRVRADREGPRARPDHRVDARLRREWLGAAARASSRPRRQQPVAA